MAGQTNIFNSLLALQEAHSDFFKRTGTQITDYLQISWHMPITVKVLNDQLPAEILEDIQQKLACYLATAV